MTSRDDTARFCTDLIAGLADAGVRYIFASPGSRSTPLTLAAANEPRISDLNVRDERSAAFMAVGYAKATGTPAAVLCTSGSAATHYLPAVVEADQAGVPLVILTSDRPVRLRNTYAPQTMNQVELFGSHVKVFVDVDDHRLDGRTVGSNLAVEATAEIPGVVHANVPLDEPLVPAHLPDPPPERPIESGIRSYDGPVDLLSDLSGKRVLFIASGRQRDGFANALDHTSRSLGAPIIADPQTAAHGPNVIHHGDLLVGVIGADGPVILDDLRPDVVVRLGPLPTSKPLWQWLEVSGVEQVLVHASRLADPLGSANSTISADPTAFLDNNPAPQPSPSSYIDEWSRLDALAGAAAALAIEGLPFPNEPEIARTLMMHAPADSLVYMASSRPIRDIDAFGVTRPDVATLANRGVNGIDGTISSAIGACLGGSPVTLLIGDIAALHDATALAEAATLGVPLRIIVVNNDGGGIFSFLPQATADVIDTETFERHWGTPHGLSLRQIAASMGMPARLVEDLDSYRSIVSTPIGGPELIELVTERRTNVNDHTIVRSAVADALGGSNKVEERP